MESQLFCCIRWRSALRCSKGVHQKSRKAVLEGRGLYPIPLVKRLWAIARGELKLKDADVKSILAEFKLESTRDIPSTQYEKIILKMRNFASASF
jgi:hypothetical protein